ncbi:hypothetical protein QBC39DRAFT_304458 [Podospora conica]|nr:hypothetical protein QBC39DRAFT_304458 [Schizothecium conicum]
MSPDTSDDEKHHTLQKKTIVFLHPDLGIGGAERLVVDAAVGLQKRGHKVVIFTSHCDPNHCFDEARDGTLDVRVRGNTLVPPSLLGRFSILCAILRQLHLILHIALFTSELTLLSPTAFFIDQLSAGLPLLRLLLPSIPILFYCHFPDLLLARGRSSPLKRLYRLPFDRLEEASMRSAAAIAVNSSFTKSIVTRTWPALAATHPLRVIYPCIAIPRAPAPAPAPADPLPWGNGTKILLSINRFERKKDVGLALRAFAALPAHLRAAGRAKLILAGGYDARVAENVEYHAELVTLASELGLTSATARTVITALSPAHRGVDVLFLLSVPGALKERLLRSAALLVYTPAGEHFGIVPLEAMLAGVPVLAAQDGGPVETVVDGETGWLRGPGEVGEWSEVMGMVLGGEDKRWREMGRKGERRVRERFSRGEMARVVDGVFGEIVGVYEREGVGKGGRGVVWGVLGVVGAGLLAVLLGGWLWLGKVRGG